MIRVLINTAQRNPRLLPVSFSKGKMHGSFQLISFLSLSIYIYIYLSIYLCLRQNITHGLCTRRLVQREREKRRDESDRRRGEREESKLKLTPAKGRERERTNISTQARY
jgi:hypothetical protein